MEIRSAAEISKTDATSRAVDIYSDFGIEGGAQERLDSKYATPARVVSGTQPQPPPFGNGRTRTPAGAEVKRLASTLRSCFQSRGTAPVAGSATGVVKHPIPVLLASAVESDEIALRPLLASTRYFIAGCGDFGRASRVLTQIVFPILLCDEELDGGNTLVSLGRLIGVTRVPSILLISDGADRVNVAGTFDVLVRPFERESLLAHLDSAYCTWLSRPTSPKAVTA